MLTVSLDNTLWIAGTVAEAAVIGLLLYRRAWRTFPVFCVYVAWGLLSDAGLYTIERFSPAGYLTTYAVMVALDSALQFGVLVELSWSVLRPIRGSLPRITLLIIAVLIVSVGAAVWPLSGIHGLADLPPQWRVLVHVQQTASILRILFFLTLVACSQLLSIGWRDRELQVATGLGFYSLVSLAVEILHSHQGMGQQYRYLNQFVVASYVCSLLYWVFSFATKEAERREFTPQMQGFLLAVAGTARTTRMALTDSTIAKSRNRGG
ncbi:MAG: hypothetical protein ABSG62_05905 [Terracidiphilus sp.]|jgi:hypothetical protein